jgi:hypothetical protein
MRLIRSEPCLLVKADLSPVPTGLYDFTRRNVLPAQSYPWNMDIKITPRLAAAISRSSSDAFSRIPELQVAATAGSSQESCLLFHFAQGHRRMNGL